MLRVENHSPSMAYGINHTPKANLGFTPGTISGAGRSLVDRVQTPHGTLERTSNTTKMGDVMLRKGANYEATMALLNKVDHQIGMFDPSTGMMNYQGPSGENVTVRPILGKTARDQAQALAGSGDRSPVAWIEVDGKTKLAVFDTSTRELKFENHNNDTMRMGRKMVESGVDTAATRALLQAVGAKTDRYDQYTGEMTFDVEGRDVTVTPILNEAQRNIARVMVPKGSYPVATMTMAGETKFLVHNTATGKIEKLSILHDLPENIADYKLHGEVPHSLKGVNAAMANNGVPVLLRLSVIAYLKEQGVSSVITAPSEGRFMVTLTSGETFGTGS